MFDRAQSTYSPAFDEQPNYDEYQLNAEEAIAAQLYDTWHEYTTLAHSAEIVVSVAEAFGEDPGVWKRTPGLLPTVGAVLEQLATTFSSPLDGPDEDEAMDAGKTLCMLCISLAVPACVIRRTR